MKAIFGPAGTADSFRAEGYKNTLQVPGYLASHGLDAFEYQCGRGVRITAERAGKLGEKFREYGITVSLHAPYFISMSSLDEEKRLNSVNYITESAKALSAMGGKRIIFHSGSCAKMPREKALQKAKDTLSISLSALDETELGEMTLCPETMGKINQLGTLDEVLRLCQIDRRLVPCIDFGHLNARDGGVIKGKSDYREIIERIGYALEDDRYKIFHSHFSKIEYTAGGEKRHLTFRDNVYGPEFEPLLDVVYEMGLSPVFICESAGTQTEDARTMKNYYEALGL